MKGASGGSHYLSIIWSAVNNPGLIAEAVGYGEIYPWKSLSKVEVLSIYSEEKSTIVSSFFYASFHAPG